MLCTVGTTQRVADPNRGALYVAVYLNAFVSGSEGSLYLTSLGVGASDRTLTIPPSGEKTYQADAAGNPAMLTSFLQGSSRTLSVQTNLAPQAPSAWSDVTRASGACNLTGKTVVYYKLSATLALADGEYTYMGRAEVRGH